MQEVVGSIPIPPTSHLVRPVRRRENPLANQLLRGFFLLRGVRGCVRQCLGICVRSSGMPDGISKCDFDPLSQVWFKSCRDQGRQFDRFSGLPGQSAAMDKALDRLNLLDIC